ncbi:MAG: putative pyridoxal kinase [Pycnora praestabilis]|nr:MAG: putative pyridoxal kinase [Pycnora praestabilis]
MSSTFRAAKLPIMSTDDLNELPVPETRVLAIASHVVYGYVGNTMAAFVMQAMGCEVAALNTVHFSNHTGYKQWRGTRASAEEIRDLYEGLQQSFLNEFDVMLTGYLPSAEAVDAVGTIGRDLKLKSSMKPGAFFWVLDPVMGDEGKLYVSEEVVPAYKNLLRDADLILPNQFEAETLSGIRITTPATLQTAISNLHKTHRLPHIIVTSVQFPPSATTTTTSFFPPMLSVVGSTALSDGTPRLFSISVPAIDCFFSGTGDMFAALTIVRLREAVSAITGLSTTKSWVSPDSVPATELPLAKAVEKVLSSMQVILEKTKVTRDKALGEGGMGRPLGIMEKEKDSEKRSHLRKTKAAEIKLVRNLDDLRRPPKGGKGRCVAVEFKVEEVKEEKKEKKEEEEEAGNGDS